MECASGVRGTCEKPQGPARTGANSPRRSAARPTALGCPRSSLTISRSSSGCGVLRHGFARVRWGDCVIERIVRVSSRGPHAGVRAEACLHPRFRTQPTTPTAPAASRRNRLPPAHNAPRQPGGSGRGRSRSDPGRSVSFAGTRAYRPQGPMPHVDAQSPISSQASSQQSRRRSRHHGPCLAHPTPTRFPGCLSRIRLATSRWRRRSRRR